MALAIRALAIGILLIYGKAIDEAESCWLCPVVSPRKSTFSNTSFIITYETIESLLVRFAEQDDAFIQLEWRSSLVLKATHAML